MNLAQVKSLYLMVKGGEATLAEAEGDQAMGPMLAAWRASLDNQGDKQFQGLATLALRGIDSTGKGYDADVLFKMMKGEKAAWFCQITGQVRELAAAVGVAQSSLVWDRGLVGKMYDQYLAAHPFDPTTAQQATVELTGDDLEADLGMVLDSLEANQAPFQLVAKWLGRDRQHVATNGDTGPLDAPTAKPSKFGNITARS